MPNKYRQKLKLSIFSNNNNNYITKIFNNKTHIKNILLLHFLFIINIITIKI